MQGAAPLAGGAVAAALCAAWALPRDLAELKGGRFEPERARAYALYGVPVSLSLVLTLVLGAVDRMLLAAFLDESAVGVYHAGYSLSNRTLDVIFLWLGMAGAPAAVAAFERGGKAGLEHAALDQARLMVLITFPAAVGVALVAAPLSEVMVGEAFRDGAAQVIPWIALSGLLAGFTTHYLNQGFTISRRTGRLVAAMGVAAVANIGLNLALIPVFGLDGALWATAASFAIGAAASWALSRDAVQLPLPWRDIARCAAACGIMALVVSAVPAIGGVLELSLKATVGALAYGVAAFALDASGVRSLGMRMLQTRRARTA
jgi:O-antigen/teichoic acid export membrane protein